MEFMIRALGGVLLGTLLAAAAYELALALRHSISPQGEGWILLTALVAMVAGAVVVFFRSVAFPGLFAPSAALFVVARFQTGDPYYAPYFRAYGDGGVFSPAWVFGLLVLALAAGVATQFWRRTAPWESAAILVLLAFTALFMGTGH